MKSNYNKLFVVLILGFLLNQQSLEAQDCYFYNQSQGDSPCANTIITAVPFLRIIPDARSGAMGDMGIAISPDANSINLNSSALAFAEKDFSISATYTPWLRAIGLNDVYLAYLAAYKKIDKLQTIGMSLRYFSLGSIQFTDINGNQLQTVNPNEVELALGYARKLGDNFSTGLNLKYIYSNLGTTSSSNGDMTPASAIAADISFNYRKPIKIDKKDASISVGLALTNLGSKISYIQGQDKDYIPANIGLGAAFEYNIDEYNAITVGVDVNKLMVPTPVPQLINGDPNPDYDSSPADGVPDYKQLSVPASIFSSFNDAPRGIIEELQEIMYSFGLEYWYNKQFALRSGYYTESKLKGNRHFLTLGFGLKYNVLGLNFSYIVPTNAQRTPIDNTLRVSLTFDFDTEKK